MSDDNIPFVDANRLAKERELRENEKQRKQAAEQNGKKK